MEGFEAGQHAEQYLYQTEADAGRPNMVSELFVYVVYLLIYESG